MVVNSAPRQTRVDEHAALAPARRDSKPLRVTSIFK